MLRNGKCYCSMCGTEFDYAPTVSYSNYSQPVPQYGQAVGYHGVNYKPVNAARREQLVQEKKHRMTWGIVFLFLFWPVSVYHFYKWYQDDKELSALR